jgi:hypothetical protein
VLAEPSDDEARTGVDLAELMARREHSGPRCWPVVPFLRAGLMYRPTGSNWNWLPRPSAFASSASSWPSAGPPAGLVQPGSSVAVLCPPSRLDPVNRTFLLSPNRTLSFCRDSGSARTPRCTVCIINCR